MTGQCRRLNACAIKLMIAAAAMLTWAAAGSAAQAKNIALVVVNASYSALDPLEAGNVASRIAGALNGAGFEVTFKEDASNGEMLALLRGLSQHDEQIDTALFYFVGYGRALGKRNFLVSENADPRSAFDLLTQGIDLGNVRKSMADSGAGLRLFVIDAAYPEARLDGIDRLGPGLGAISPEPEEAFLLGGETGAVLSPAARPATLSEAWRSALSRPDRSLIEMLAEIRAVVGRSNERSRLPVLIGANADGPFLYSAEPAPAPQPEPEPQPEPVATAPAEPAPVEPTPDAEPATATTGGPVVRRAPGTWEETPVEEAPATATAPATTAAIEPELDGPAYEATLTDLQLKRVQIALSTIGLYSGAIDGQFGRLTRNAITIFQRSRGLDPTGYLKKSEMMALFEVSGV
ncbi:MAG: peptidoglycan-binding protein [Pseudomonadota bacterium]